MIEEFSVMSCDICNQILGWYYFDKDVQVRYTVHCNNCQVRLVKGKKIKPKRNQQIE